MNICSKLVGSNVKNVSIDALVQLEEHLETALSVTRAKKVSWFRNVYSFLNFVCWEQPCCFCLLQTELMLKLVENLKEKVRYLLPILLYIRYILFCVVSVTLSLLNELAHIFATFFICFGFQILKLLGLETWSVIAEHFEL